MCFIVGYCMVSHIIRCGKRTSRVPRADVSNDRNSTGIVYIKVVDNCESWRRLHGRYHKASLFRCDVAGLRVHRVTSAAIQYNLCHCP